KRANLLVGYDFNITGLSATLRALDDFELDALPLFQRFVPVAFNFCVMHKNLFARVLFDKSISQLVVKPFNFPSQTHFANHLPFENKKTRAMPWRKTLHMMMLESRKNETKNTKNP